MAGSGRGRSPGSLSLPDRSGGEPVDMELHGAGAEDGRVEEEPGRYGRHVRELE